MPTEAGNDLPSLFSLPVTCDAYRLTVLTPCRCCGPFAAEPTAAWELVLEWLGKHSSQKAATFS